MDEKIIIEGRKGKAHTVRWAILAVSGFVISPILFSLDFVEWMIIPPAWISIVCLLLSVFSIIMMIVELLYKNVSIVVTDKRVYGTTAWGRRVDLPLDMISAVGTSAMNGITVSTPSGVIKFKHITNDNSVHSAISKILLERQEKAKVPTTASPAQTVVNPTSAEELKQFKELLDSGVITQEEFDAKKKQLLGL